MSETTLCKHYSEYCSNAGIYHGGGYDSVSSMVGGVASKTVDALKTSLERVSSDFAKTMRQVSSSGASDSVQVVKAMNNTLKNINASALAAVDKSGNYMTSKFAKVMMGGVETTFDDFDSLYGGDVDPAITHASYMIDCIEFAGGASHELSESLEARMSAFSLYLHELMDLSKRLSEVKGADKEKLKFMLEEQYNFIKKAYDEFNKLKNLIGPSSDISKKLDELAKHGKIDEMKKLLKTRNVNKELIDDYITLLRSQGHVAVRSHEIEKATKTIGMTMEQFKKLDSYDKIEDAISIYEKELFKKHGKDKAKFLNALDKVKKLAIGQVGSYEGGICPCTNDDTSYNFDPDMMSGGVDYFGGDFLGLEKEVEYEALTNKIIDENELLKRSFIKAQSQYIAKMLQAAQKAAFEVSSKGNFDDHSILLFLFRLKNLKAVDTDELVRIFATHTKNYNAEYIRKSIINDLDDIIEAAKGIESKIGPAMREFASSIEDYKKFLNKSYEENRISTKMTGGSINCSGITNSNIYDRFMGGEIDLTIDEVVNAFNSSIMIGRMKNGMNLSLEDLGKFSIEQDKINETVLSKLSNQINASANEMVSKYKDEETFPVKKQLFETVLRDNIRGQVGLQHAAQAMDKKIRTYQKHIIADPLAAKEIADLLGKVTIDTNWMPDKEFTEMTKFCEYFHNESVAKNLNQYTAANVGVAKMINATNVAIGHAIAAASDGTLVQAVGAGGVGITFNFDFAHYANNEYIKENKYSPLPISSEHCLEFSVPTLVLATKSGKFDPEKDKQTVRAANNDIKKVVNMYDGTDVFPAKAYPHNYDGSDGYTIFSDTSCNQVNDKAGSKQNSDAVFTGDIIPSSIYNPVLLPRTVKFLGADSAMKNYMRALKHAENSADMLLNLRNLFSIFESIDDIYKRKSGSGDDGVKIGQIYGAVKQYLILTSMYPIIYKHGDEYRCGFIGMRHFGHDVVVPFETEDDIRYNNSASSLLGDLADYNLSLREFESGRDYVYDDVALGTGPFPSHDGNDTNFPAANKLYVTPYSERFAHEFKARYTRFDLLLTMMIKSMFAKVMSVLAMYNLITFNGKSGDGMEDNLSFAKLRTIYGGDMDMENSRNMYSFLPEVRPECTELYVRLYYYVIFYKKLFMEETSKKVIEQVVALRRFALLPTSDSKFSEIIKLFFLKKFSDKVDESKYFVNDNDLITYVSECNKLYDSETGGEKARFEKIIKEFIRDINNRYGLVKTDSMLTVMDARQKKEYPDFERMKSRDEFVSKEKLIKARKLDTYVKPKLLDGEDSPIGNLGAPSAKRESNPYPISGVDSIITPVKTEYRSEELLAAVYNFRTKLDGMTEKLTAMFNSSTKHKQEYRQSLFSHILSLKQKLSSRSDSMSRFRIFKEYINDFESNKIFNIPTEVLLYRELVINGLNLLYKLYVRIVANVRLYGTENEWTEPLLRGTYLYYLDSINTDLVKVNRLGKSPVLDFSTLQTVMDRYLNQTREFYMQLSSGVSEKMNKKVEKVLSSMTNIHRAVFKTKGLIDSINYEDKPDEQAGTHYTRRGVKLAAINDYSEYQHAAYLGDTVGKNSFILDQCISKYPDPVTVIDPRNNTLKEIVPTLEFELLSKHFSPKNIYVMFEYLLVNMYKLYYEKSGVWYGPLLEEFVSSLSHVDIGFDVTKPSLGELGGVEYFEADMPFSNKVIALFKTVYRYRTGSKQEEGLVQNDISLLPAEMKETMKKSLPVYLMLFKFIIKQAYLHLGMVTDGSIYESGDEIVPSHAVSPYLSPDQPLKEIIGAGGYSKEETISRIRFNADEIVKQATNSRVSLVSGINTGGLSGTGVVYNNIKSSSSTINGIKSNLLLGAYIKDSVIDKSVKPEDIFGKFIKVVRQIASNKITKDPSLYDEFMHMKEYIKRQSLAGLTKLNNTHMLKGFLADMKNYIADDDLDRIKTSLDQAILARNVAVITGSSDEYSDTVLKITRSKLEWGARLPTDFIDVTAAFNAANVNLRPIGLSMRGVDGDYATKEAVIGDAKALIDVEYKKHEKECNDCMFYMEITRLKYVVDDGSDANFVTAIEPYLTEKYSGERKDKFKKSSYKHTLTLLTLLERDDGIDATIRAYAKDIETELRNWSDINGNIDTKYFFDHSKVINSDDPSFKDLNKKCADSVSSIFSECGNLVDGTYYVNLDTLDIIRSGKGSESYNKFVNFFSDKYCNKGSYSKYNSEVLVKSPDSEKYEEYLSCSDGLLEIRNILTTVLDAGAAGMSSELKNLLKDYNKKISYAVDKREIYSKMNANYSAAISTLAQIMEYKDPLNAAVPPAAAVHVKQDIITIIYHTNLVNLLGKYIPSLYLEYNRSKYEELSEKYYNTRNKLVDAARRFYNIIDGINTVLNDRVFNSAVYKAAEGTNIVRTASHVDAAPYSDTSITLHSNAVQLPVAGTKPLLEGVLALESLKNTNINDAISNYNLLKTNLEDAINRFNNGAIASHVIDYDWLCNDGIVNSPSHNVPVANNSTEAKRRTKLRNVTLNPVGSFENVNSEYKKFTSVVNSLQIVGPNIMGYVGTLAPPAAVGIAAPASVQINIVRVDTHNLAPPMKVVATKDAITFSTDGIDNNNYGGPFDNTILASNSSLFSHTAVIGVRTTFATDILSLNALADAIGGGALIAPMKANIVSIAAAAANGRNYDAILNLINAKLLLPAPDNSVTVFGVGNKRYKVTDLTHYTMGDKNIGAVFIQRVYMLLNTLAFNSKFLLTLNNGAAGGYSSVGKLATILLTVLVNNTNIVEDNLTSYIETGYNKIIAEVAYVKGLRADDGTDVAHRDKYAKVVDAFAEFYKKSLMEGAIKTGTFTGGDAMFVGGVGNAAAKDTIAQKYADIIKLMDVDIKNELFSPKTEYAVILYEHLKNKIKFISEDELLTLIAHYILYANSSSQDPAYHRSLLDVFKNIFDYQTLIDLIDSCVNGINYLSSGSSAINRSNFKSPIYDDKGGSRAYSPLFPIEITESKKNYYFNINDGFNNEGGPPPGDVFNKVGDKIIGRDTIVARAKNAIKYATIIYKSLFKVYTSIAETPKYLGLAPYITDVYEIIGKEDTFAPLSLAIDAIPTICNSRFGNDECNILKALEHISDRKGLGLRCNNIFELEKLFTERLPLIEALNIFLVDDRIHGITINDFPHFKSLINNIGQVDIIRNNISQTAINNHIIDFGKLTKYLYEIDFKSMFANSFPVFNSLDNPKYLISTQTHYTTTFNEFGHKLAGKSLLNSLPSLLDFSSPLFLTRDAAGYRGGFLEILSLNTNVIINGVVTNNFSDYNLLCNKIKDIYTMITMMELRTNSKEIIDYVSYDREIGDFKSTKITNVSDLMIKNILDVGIMPININAMMREIPLANTINSVYSFDIIINWLQRKFKESNYGATREGTTKSSTDQPFITDKLNTVSNYYVRKYSNYLKNPMNARMIPVDKSLLEGTCMASSCYGNDIKGLPKGKVGLKRFNGMYTDDNIFAKRIGDKVTMNDQTRYTMNQQFNGHAAVSKLNYSINLGVDVADFYSESSKKYNLEVFGYPGNMKLLVDKLSTIMADDYAAAIGSANALFTAGGGFVNAVNAVGRDISSIHDSQRASALFYHICNETAADIETLLAAGNLIYDELLHHFSAADLVLFHGVATAYNALARKPAAADLGLRILLLMVFTETTFDCIKYMYCADLLATANDDQLKGTGIAQPVNYNYFPSFVNNEGYVLSSKLVDIGIATFADKSKLVSDLVGDFKDIDSASGKESYYNKQMMYNPTESDLYAGVDPDLQSPVLGVNIYSDILLDLYKREFKYRYENPSKIFNINTLATGTNSLYRM